MEDVPENKSQQSSAAQVYAAEDARLVKAVEDAQDAFDAKSERPAEPQA